MGELNVPRQPFILSRMQLVESAWKRGRRTSLLGTVYDLHDGLLKQLLLHVDGQDQGRRC